MNDCENIIAVKEASGDMSQIKDVIALMETLIDAKKTINADYSADIKVLEQIQFLT